MMLWLEMTLVSSPAQMQKQTKSYKNSNLEMEDHSSQYPKTNEVAVDEVVDDDDIEVVEGEVDIEDEKETDEMEDEEVDTKVLAVDIEVQETDSVDDEKKLMERRKMVRKIISGRIRTN